MNVILEIGNVIMTKKIFGTFMVIVVSIILIKILNMVISNILITGRTPFEVKRRKTIVKLFQSIFRYLVYAISLLIVLSFFDVDTKSLITSLGVLGVVLGLALQDTVKDFIGGIALILENYFVIGDTVTYNDFTGEVVNIGLRTTKIKKYSGEVLIVANRNIDTIINSSQNEANILLEIDTAYEIDNKKVEKVLKDIINKAIKENLIFEDSEYLGINDLGAHSVKYLMNIRCEKNKKYAIKRELLTRIKIAYEKNNIKIPYNQIEVHYGEKL